LTNDAFGHQAGDELIKQIGDIISSCISGNDIAARWGGDQIPIESKIIALADSFDAMTTERTYRVTPLSLEEAIVEMKKYSGTQFDKTVVDVFINKVLK